VQRISEKCFSHNHGRVELWISTGLSKIWIPESAEGWKKLRNLRQSANLVFNGFSAIWTWFWIVLSTFLGLAFYVLLGVYLTSRDPRGKELPLILFSHKIKSSSLKSEYLMRPLEVPLRTALENCQDYLLLLLRWKWSGSIKWESGDRGTNEPQKVSSSWLVIKFWWQRAFHYLNLDLETRTQALPSIPLLSSSFMMTDELRKDPICSLHVPQLPAPLFFLHVVKTKVIIKCSLWRNGDSYEWVSRLLIYTNFCPGSW
jgi:hypothetical protein